MSKNEDLKYDFAIADSDIVDENKEIISDDEADVDDNMVFRAKAGDEKSLNHILRKYRNFVRSKAKPFFIFINSDIFLDVIYKPIIINMNIKEIKNNSS